MKKSTVLFGLLLILLITVLLAVSAVAPSFDESDPIAPMELFWIAAVVVPAIFFLKWLLIKACPSCGQPRSFRRTTAVIDRSFWRTDRKNQMNSSAKWRCKHCGHEEWREETPDQ